jgi:hypothetical protein
MYSSLLRTTFRRRDLDFAKRLLQILKSRNLFPDEKEAVEVLEVAYKAIAACDAQAVCKVATYYACPTLFKEFVALHFAHSAKEAAKLKYKVVNTFERHEVFAGASGALDTSQTHFFTLYSTPQTELSRSAGNRSSRRPPNSPPFQSSLLFNMAKQTCSYMVKISADIFELPKLFGILQYVEYDPSQRERVNNGCLYEGILTAEGCRRGVCLRYCVQVFSRDRKNWVIERRTRIEWGGCVPQTVADALWELADRYDVGVWYEYRYRYQFGDVVREKKDCYLLINGVKLSVPYCRSVNECIELILEDYRREVEKLKEPPIVSSRNPAEELLRKYPELEAFGAEWVRKWAPHAKERLAEIAEMLRRYPWMVEAVKKSPLDNVNPYAVEMYVAKDSSVVCLSLSQQRMYCTQNGAAKAVELELGYVRHEVYEGKKLGVYRPKGLLVFSTLAKEYVKIL